MEKMVFGKVTDHGFPYILLVVIFPLAQMQRRPAMQCLVCSVIIVMSSTDTAATFDWTAGSDLQADYATRSDHGCEHRSLHR